MPTTLPTPPAVPAETGAMLNNKTLGVVTSIVPASSLPASRDTPEFTELSTVRFSLMGDRDNVRLLPAAGILDTRANGHGDAVKVEFVQPLGAPGVERRDASGNASLTHRYAVPGDGEASTVALATYQGAELSTASGWQFLDGAANTAYDLRNVASAVWRITEEALGWDTPAASRYYRHDASTNRFVLRADAISKGYLDEIQVQQPEYPGGAGANAVVGIYNRSSGTAISLAIDAGSGEDSVLAGASAIVFDGGADRDTISYASLQATSSVNVVAAAAAGSYNVTKNLVGETVFSEGLGRTSLSDGSSIQVRHMTAGVMNTRVTDKLANVERIIGTNGNDTFTGGAGDDHFSGLNGNDRYAGGFGDDVFILGRGQNTLDGGAGRDLADYSALDAGVEARITESKGGAVGKVYKIVDGKRVADSLRNIEGLVGTAQADKLSATIAHATLHGGAGDDILTSSDSEAWLYGDAGDDVLTAGAHSWLWGGSGNDRLTAGNGAVLNGDAGNDRLVAGDGSFLIGDDGDDFMQGGANGALWGGEGQDILEGGEGSRLIGGGGNDLLRGGAGAVLDGGAGDDILHTHVDGRAAVNAGAGHNEVFLGGSAIVEGDSGDTVFHPMSGVHVYRFEAVSGRDHIDTQSMPLLYGSLPSVHPDVVQLDMWALQYHYDIHLARVGTDLKISIGNVGMELTIDDWYAGWPFYNAIGKLEIFAADHYGQASTARATVPAAALANLTADGADIRIVGGVPVMVQGTESIALQL